MPVPVQSALRTESVRVLMVVLILLLMLMLMLLVVHGRSEHGRRVVLRKGAGRPWLLLGVRWMVLLALRGTTRLGQRHELPLQIEATRARRRALTMMLQVPPGVILGVQIPAGRGWYERVGQRLEVVDEPRRGDEILRLLRPNFARRTCGSLDLAGFAN